MIREIVEAILTLGLWKVSAVSGGSSSGVEFDVLAVLPEHTRDGRVDAPQRGSRRREHQHGRPSRLAVAERLIRAHKRQEIAGDEREVVELDIGPSKCRPGSTWAWRAR